MITIIEYGQNLVKLLYFNSFVAIKILRIQDAFIPFPLQVIFVVSVCFYMDMNCFRLVRVVASLLRVGSVTTDIIGWVVADDFGWLQMVSGGLLF